MSPDNRDDRDDRIGRTLRELGQTRLAPPPLSAELESELGKLAPKRTRSPRLGFVVTGAVSLLCVGVLVGVYGLRPDLPGLPWLWIVLYCAAWFASFVAIGWLALVPGPGQVMPNWRYAGMGAAVASIGFVAAGLLFDRHVPGVSILGKPSMRDMLGLGYGCLSVGVITALVPVMLGALSLRGRVPVGARWVGAGLGAAGGSLSGLHLHLHCHIADKLHLGIIHGGVVVVSALIGALLIPRAAGR